jgi:hypothetical protein
MNTLTKFALGMMGQLRPKPAVGDAATTIALPPPARHGGLLIRAWIDRAAIADALGLTHDQQVLLAQTAGFPK